LGSFPGSHSGMTCCAELANEQKMITERRSFFMMILHVGVMTSKVICL